MLKMDIKIEGEAALNSWLGRTMIKIKNAKPLMKFIGVVLRGEFIKTMNKGVDPNGTALAPVTPWTRAINPATGKSRNNARMTPLMNTGSLRNSMGTVKSTNDSLEFGWTGKGLQIADHMINGIAGMMRIRTDKMQTGKQGAYIRINTGTGWITKKVYGGMIHIKPRARNFFFLSSKQIRAIIEATDRWLESQIKAA